VIRLIAAIDTKHGIARASQIPWDLPSDRAYFKAQTLKFGGNILMGHKTFSQLNNPLIGRTNYVASHLLISLPNGVALVNNLESFLNNFREDLWVIGGESIYAQTIGRAQELYLTTIESDFNCDQFFPNFNNFNLKSSNGPNKENNQTFYFEVFERS
jgi:dihydrofolate reductase